MGKDSDTFLKEWLRDGVPVGVAREVRPGGYFPRAEPGATATEAEVLKRNKGRGNHPSFYKDHGEEVPPWPSPDEGRLG